MHPLFCFRNKGFVLWLQMFHGENTQVKASKSPKGTQELTVVTSGEEVAGSRL